MSTLFADIFVYDAQAPGAMSGPTDVLVVGNLIAAIGSEANQKFQANEDNESVAERRRIDGRSRMLVLPGLINAHFHSPANHLKGSLPSLPLELFMLYESPAEEYLTPTPREAYLRTMLGALEMLRTGVTAVQDDAFLMPFPTPEIIDAVMQAYADCGIRATVALDQPELPESAKYPVSSALDPDTREAMEAPAPMGADGLLEMYDYLIDTWHGAHGGRLSAAVSVSAPQRVTPTYFRKLDALSRAHDLPVFVHMLETKLQRTLATTQPRFAGRSLVEYTADLGLLNERTNVIHAVWVDDRDLELIASAGSTIVHNPVSNLRLGSGIAPYRRFMQFGIPTALGIDEAICDDSCNLWGVVKMAGLIHNVSGLDGDLWPSSREILSSLWEGGAAALRRPRELGEVRPGYLADLVVLDLDDMALTPFNDLSNQLVYCESGDGVLFTMVDGQIVYENGAVCTVDQDALLEEARQLFAAKLPLIQKARANAATLLPHYQALVREAAATDVGMNRWVGSL